MKDVMYVIVRDYRDRDFAPELGCHALADFREEEYARDYLKILKRRWLADEKIYPQSFEWKLCKRWYENGRVWWEDMDGSPMTEQVCVNEADWMEISRVTGLGKTTAMKIVLYRQEHGKYQNLMDLMDVHGIGPVLYERIRGKVRL